MGRADWYTYGFEVVVSEWYTYGFEVVAPEWYSYGVGMRLSSNKWYGYHA